MQNISINVIHYQFSQKIEEFTRLYEEAFNQQIINLDSANFKRADKYFHELVKIFKDENIQANLYIKQLTIFLSKSDNNKLNKKQLYRRIIKNANIAHKSISNQLIIEQVFINWLIGKSHLMLEELLLAKKYFLEAYDNLSRKNSLKVSKNSHIISKEMILIDLTSCLMNLGEFSLVEERIHQYLANKSIKNCNNKQFKKLINININNYNYQILFTLVCSLIELQKFEQAKLILKNIILINDSQTNNLININDLKARSYYLLSLLNSKESTQIKNEESINYLIKSISYIKNNNNLSLIKNIVDLIYKLPYDNVLLTNFYKKIVEFEQRIYINDEKIKLVLIQVLLEQDNHEELLKLISAISFDQQSVFRILNNMVTYMAINDINKALYFHQLLVEHPDYNQTLTSLFKDTSLSYACYFIIEVYQLTDQQEITFDLIDKLINNKAVNSLGLNNILNLHLNQFYLTMKLNKVNYNIDQIIQNIKIILDKISIDYHDNYNEYLYNKLKFNDLYSGYLDIQKQYVQAITITKESLNIVTNQPKNYISEIFENQADYNYYLSLAYKNLEYFYEKINNKNDQIIAKYLKYFYQKDVTESQIMAGLIACDLAEITKLEKFHNSDYYQQAVECLNLALSLDKSCKEKIDNLLDCSYDQDNKITYIISISQKEDPKQKLTKLKNKQQRSLQANLSNVDAKYQDNLNQQSLNLTLTNGKKISNKTHQVIQIDERTSIVIDRKEKINDNWRKYINENQQSNQCWRFAHKENQSGIKNLKKNKTENDFEIKVIDSLIGGKRLLGRWTENVIDGKKIGLITKETKHL